MNSISTPFSAFVIFIHKLDIQRLFRSPWNKARANGRIFINCGSPYMLSCNLLKKDRQNDVHQSHNHQRWCIIEYRFTVNNNQDRIFSSSIISCSHYLLFEYGTEYAKDPKGQPCFAGHSSNNTPDIKKNKFLFLFLSESICLLVKRSKMGFNLT